MKPTIRFTQTVEHYAKYRPQYPNTLLPLLSRLDALHSHSVVADIGSGTGILTRDLLEKGHTVYAVEPNQAMRDAAEGTLSSFHGFKSIEGSGEATTLPKNSVDLITIATAFHWLDPLKAKQECSRILKKKGHVALIWNTRDVYASPLMYDYENLLIEYAIDYDKHASQKYDESVIKDFFSPNAFLIESLPNKQVFNKFGLVGRLLSTSYIPREDKKILEKMIQRIEEIFDRHASQGEIEFLYQTKLYLGELDVAG